MTVIYEPSFARAPQPTAFARGVALTAYVLLLLGPLTLGCSALLALVIAYARRDGASPLIRSHHRFQIRIFWIALALFAASGALGLAAVFEAARAPPAPLRIPLSPQAQIAVWRPGAGDAAPALAPPPRLQPARFEGFAYRLYGGPTWSARARREGYAALAVLGLAGLWSVLAPLWGALRLASGRAIGHSPG